MQARTSIIETARRAAGMSQAELADRARTPQSAVTERLLAAASADLVVVPGVE